MRVRTLSRSRKAIAAVRTLIWTPTILIVVYGFVFGQSGDPSFSLVGTIGALLWILVIAVIVGSIEVTVIASIIRFRHPYLIPLVASWSTMSGPTTTTNVSYPLFGDADLDFLIKSWASQLPVTQFAPVFSMVVPYFVLVSNHLDGAVVNILLILIGILYGLFLTLEKTPASSLATYSRCGDALRTDGNLSAAEVVYRKAVELAQRATTATGEINPAKELSAAYMKLGDVQHVLRNHPDAHESYRKGIAVAAEIASSVPGIDPYQRQFSAYLDKLGDLLVEMSDFAASADAYRGSLAIRQKLASAIPQTKSQQRDLAKSYFKVGEALVCSQRLQDSLPYFDADIVIMEKLIEQDPANVNWQEELDTSRSMRARAAGR